MDFQYSFPIKFIYNKNDEYMYTQIFIDWDEAECND